MSGDWQTKLRDGGIVLLDGGTGAELRRRGVTLDRHAWSGPAALTHRDLLVDIHADYLRAGADVVTTNTFGTSRFVLRAAGLEREFVRINRAAVDAARTACGIAGRDAAVAGAVSCLPPGFDVAAYPDPQAERDAYFELATLLAEAGVDLLVLEMMEDTEHARRACEAVRAVGLPFWIGVSATLVARGDRAPALAAYDFPDVPFDDVLDALLDLEPAVVNVMHTPPRAVDAALAAVRARWRGFVGAYPELPEPREAPERLEAPEPSERSQTSAGAPARAGSAPWTPERFAHAARGWIASGARVVGGCCGATPEHIRALAAAIDAQRPGPTPP